jgi:hypothetical protein
MIMTSYCIIETDAGWGVFEHPVAGTAEQAARELGGVVIDPGPYDSYEDACDALEALQGELDESDVSDVPGSRPPEGRFEIPG